MSSRKGDKVVLVIRNPIRADDVPALCERARALLDVSDARVIVCDVGALDDPDVATVDSHARLQLGAQRLGARVALRNARRALRELIDLAGLCETLGVEVRREPEEREEPLGVEEEVQPGDPAP